MHEVTGSNPVRSTIYIFRPVLNGMIFEEDAIWCRPATSAITLVLGARPAGTLHCGTATWHFYIPLHLSEVSAAVAQPYLSPHFLLA
jgi:hypothetical protein